MVRACRTAGLRGSSGAIHFGVRLERDGRTGRPGLAPVARGRGRAKTAALGSIEEPGALREKLQPFLGLDVHEGSIGMAVAKGGSFEPGESLGRIAHDGSPSRKRSDARRPHSSLVKANEADR